MDIITFLKSAVSILGILGIPSIGAMTAWCVKKCYIASKQIKILMSAQQAQMRSQLLKDYKIYVEKETLTELEITDWENQYQAYHSLGANGVLDAKRNELLAKPIKG